MENHQLHVIEQLADRLGMSQGEVLRIAHEVAGGEIVTIFDLDRKESDALICSLDSLVAA